MSLFRSSVSQYRSSHYEVKRNLIKSRNRQRKRAQQLRVEVDAQKAEVQRLRSLLKQTEEQLALTRQLEEIDNAMAAERDAFANCPLQSEMPIAGHCFTATVIALCTAL